MKVYSYSAARQRLAELLNRARREGQVEIRRRDGQVFIVRAGARSGSPLDVPAVRTNLSREEVVGLVRESRRSTERLLKTAAGSDKRSKPARARRHEGSRRKHGTPPRG